MIGGAVWTSRPSQSRCVRGVGPGPHWRARRLRAGFVVWPRFARVVLRAMESGLIRRLAARLGIAEPDVLRWVWRRTPLRPWTLLRRGPRDGRQHRMRGARWGRGIRPYPRDFPAVGLYERARGGDCRGRLTSWGATGSVGCTVVGRGKSNLGRSADTS